MTRSYEVRYKHTLELDSGIILEGVSWVSNSGKSFVMRVTDADGISRYNRTIPIDEVVYIDGEIFTLENYQKGIYNDESKRVKSIFE